MFSELPDDAIVTPAFRALKQQLLEEERVTGNRPMMQMRMGPGDSQDFERAILASRGVDVDSLADQQVIEATRVLIEQLRRAPAETTADELRGLWAQVEALTTLIAELEPAPHVATLNSARDMVCASVERIATSEAYSPGSEGLPSPTKLVEKLDQLNAAPFPPLPSDRESMSLNSWDQRVYLASVLTALVAEWGEAHPEFVDRVIGLLKDPAPPVRDQVSRSLSILWNIDRPRMWTEIFRFADTETSADAMGHFVGGSLARVAPADPEKGEEALARVLARFPPNPAEDHGVRELERHIGGMTAGLIVGKGRPRASGYVDDWLADIGQSSHRLHSLLWSLHDAILLRWAVDAPKDAAAIQGRARDLALRIVRVAAAELARTDAIVNRADTPQEERAAAIPTYQAAAQLLDDASNQLYIQTGAFGSDNGAERPGLGTIESKREFLVEYEAVLDAITNSGLPAAVHHILQVYEFLADAAPEHVFDKVAQMLTGPAAQQQYHYESLGNDALIKMVRSYLADHRDVFNDPGRRASLVRLLDLFSAAGWPAALQLLYELPDLLR